MDTKKEGKTKINKKIKYLENGKRFLDEIKIAFSWLWKGCHLVKNKNVVKNGENKL